MLPLSISGLQLEALAFNLCGTLVRGLDPSGAAACDGRLRPGDLVLFLNHESLWRVTSSQAKIVIRRAEFVSTGIPYVPRSQKKLTMQLPILYGERPV